MMNRLILNKATSSNDEPTPGYLYNEITQMTFCSKESLGLVGEYLLKKLQRTDLNVKLKTLKIMKHLCDKKRADFRNFLKKKMDIIKECQQCNIVNDELKGETPSMLVRKEATDLIKLIYSYDATENVMKSSSNNSQDTMKNNRIEGFGNTVFDNKNNQNNQNYQHNQHNNIYNHSNNNYNNNMYHNNDRNIKTNMETYGNKFVSNNYNNKNNYMSKMSGFGNPYFNQNPVQKTKGEIAIKYLNEVANKYIPSSFVNKINRVSASLSKNYSNGSLNIHSIMNGRAFNKGLEKNHMKRAESHYYNKNNINSMNSMNSMNYMNNHNNNHNNNNNNYYYNSSRRNENILKPHESQQAGLYENKIIQDILLTTGINKVPSENVLNEFAIKCKTLDTKLIVSILTEKLKKSVHDEEENYKYKYKVLSIIKHLLFFRTNEEKETLIETLEVLIQNLKNQTLEELYKCKEIKQLKKIVIEIFVLMGLQKKTNTQENEKNININLYQNQASMELPNLLDMDDDITPPINNNNMKKNITMGDAKIFHHEKNISDDLMSLSQNFSNGTLNKNKKTGIDNNEQFNNQWNNKKDKNMENLLCDLENISINNNELFNSLNVKGNNTQILYNNMKSNQNEDKTYYNKQQCNNKNNMNKNYNNNDKFNLMNSNNDLIFFENKKESNTKEINVSSKPTNQTNLNDEGLFFHLNQQNIYEHENKLIDINNDSTNNSLNTYFNNISQNTYEKDNIINTTSLNNNIKTSNINYVHDNHLKMADDQIDNFFNSFTLSSKKNEQNNTKPNVKIDAFELLSDHMKL
ncbi:hypothetical protein PFHG_04913 [Plasmodium falciparum HB3]|uniref:ENTH domain-containing protein n=3 Tax=Plasmodium falciparum TaxID=5833 RepID=A0A0L7KJ95_PLAFX|nr:hypothetical protein PFHG_04913 [Plasmodium falciparum HB3]